MKRRSIKIGLAAALGLIALAVWIKPQVPVDEMPWSKRYDHHYKKQAKHYFGVLFDWRWFKAQGIVESGLTKNARSSKGAMGIMQILPETFDEVFAKPLLLPEITEPRWNIAAGIAYDRYLYNRWSQLVPRAERLAFTFASYNAGFSTVKHAYNLAREKGHDANEFVQISRYLPGQTRRYLKKIFHLMGKAE